MVMTARVGGKGGMAPAHYADSSVMIDQLVVSDVSPFAEACMDAPVATPKPQHQHQQVQQRRKAPGPLSRLLLCCTAPSVVDRVAAEHPTNSYIRVAEHAASPLQSPMRSQASWGKVFAEKQHLQSTYSVASSEYYDARSTCSDITPQHSLDRASPLPAGVVEGWHRGVDQQQQAVQVPQTPQELPHWVPPQQLLFAPPGLKFVPVPAVTGFAGIWEVVPERTSPHPQPIDVMCNANAIVRKIHASIPGIVIDEDERFMKLTANPGFIPKGLPSAHCETYDKTHETCPSWMPRRDVNLGFGQGHVYFTEDGMLVIRHETRGLLSRKPDYIVEDYLTLEEEGTVIVDRMCCQNTKTGARAEQIQVVRLKSRPGQE